MKPRMLLQALGVAAFLLFRLYVSAIAHPSELRMHSSVPLTNYALSLIVNLVLAALVFALLTSWIVHSQNLRWLRFFLPGLVAALLTEAIGVSLSARLPSVLYTAIFLGITIAAIALHVRLRRGEQVLFHLTDSLLVGIGIFSFFVVVQLIYIAAWRPVPDSFAHVPAAALGSENHRRVVWILFDELSYQQTFGDRYPNLRLPNFDKLRETSTLFTQAQPVEAYTELAIPSILLGHPIARVNYTFHNKLLVMAAGKSSFQSFDATQTPFGQAREQGLTAGVVGWYNPYCSMLAPYLNQCYWFSTNEEGIPQQYGIRDGFWKDLATPWMHSMTDIFDSKRKNWLASRHMETYKDLIRHSDGALEQPNLDFILIHLPLPHPPGIYNRETRQFDETGKRSYIDNLALADKSLGQLIDLLQRSPRWKDTSVIVCGDHSWRTWLWSPRPSWTAEDEAASHRRTYDSRPLIMIHLAGQTTPGTVAAPFPLLRVHTILDDLVEGKQPIYSYAGR